ncbi:MAG: BCCT family transporter [Gammaproteobacteria bacterium]|nr:BCCT family transporter [Gammaproteobacteria bacterium]MBT5205462.1 BCCT family transporter [Gammaproteobacteria bacterium]MBT6246351.1 BCCT family transporter [Gammaproteobacteria bacterium]
MSKSKSRVSGFVIISLITFSSFAAFDLEAASALTLKLRDLVVNYFDWLLIITSGLILVFLVALLFHPKAGQILGRRGEVAEFSRWSWFAMLFSAGMGPGLLYWGAAEPILHLANNPLLVFGGIEAGSEQATVPAIVVTVFHFGLHGWSMYALAALAIAYSAYRHNQPLSFSTALTPLLGQTRINGRTGSLIDCIALYGTVFGVATSVGLSVSIMNAAVEPLTGLSFDLYNQIIIVILVCLLGIISAISGVNRGIRRISELNIWLSLMLLLTFLAVGPVAEIIVNLLSTLIAYFLAVLPMGFWIGSSADEQSWQASWTVFYWGWWFAWTPFVALFVARISRGRTIREFIIGVLLVPTLVIILWMSVFGGTAIHQELNESGLISSPVNLDYSLGLIASIHALNLGEMKTILFMVVTFLLFTWLITSLDSATLVICNILDVSQSTLMKIIWGFVLGTVSCTLMLVGGIEALQAASVIIGLPMALMMLMIIASMIRLILAKDT